MTSRLGDPGFLEPARKARIDAVVANRTRTLTVVMEAFCDPQNVNAVAAHLRGASGSRSCTRSRGP